MKSCESLIASGKALRLVQKLKRPLDARTDRRIVAFAEFNFVLASECRCFDRLADSLGNGSPMKGPGEGCRT